VSVRRKGLIAVGLATAAAALLAGCGSGGPGGSGGGSHGGSEVVGDNGTAPSCLAKKVNVSAELPGTQVEVSPAPESVTANPATQISFLGAPASDIHDVTVTGSESGVHSGRLQAYSQGDGASFLPAKPFRSGERVTVAATVASAGRQRKEHYSFRVATPYPTSEIEPFPNPVPKPNEYQTFDTIPAMQAPLLTVTTPDEDPSAGDIFTSNGPGPGRYGALIYSPEGRLIWFHQLSHGLTADDVNVQEYEGQRDLTFWQGRVLSLGYGDGEDLIMNDRYHVIAKVRAGNGLMADLHEFQLAPDGIAYITAYNPIRCDLASVEGGPSNGAILDATFQEIDIKTGLVRYEWHALDHMRAQESETSPPSTRAWDWFHINSIDPQPDGNIFISARNTWAGYQIEAHTGRIAWRLGGLKSSFQMRLGTRTHWQHDGRILPDGEVTFFDDGANPVEERQSRGVQIRLDFATHQATLTKSYVHSPPLLAASQGNMQTLPSGNVFLGYGGVAQITEYSPEGAVLFDAHFPYDFVFYRAFRHPWSAQPTTRPAIAANLNNTSEETVVHASWNGATGVASWRVLAGGQSARLTPIITFADTGFESSCILTKAYGHVAVQALGSEGQVLATSATTKPTSYKASLEGEGE
jgi:Arylsulfotransferase (ASST)